MQILRFVSSRDDDDYAYHAALSEAWTERGMLVNIEHDMEHSHALTIDLLACPHPLCSHAYQMHIPHDHWAHGHLPATEWQREEASGIRWVSDGEEWAGYSGLGFCKIAPEARTGPIEREHWRLMERNVNRVVKGPWHLHWPGVEHYHYR